MVKPFWVKVVKGVLSKYYPLSHHTVENQYRVRPRIQDDIPTLQARHDFPVVSNVASAPAVSAAGHRCPCSNYQERQFNVLQAVNPEKIYGLENKVISSKKIQDVIVDGDPDYPF
ncbi:535_t:CDS:2 [Acaulospora morrowiae]|uniref:535_t:CDS:1 n=1 Tax=Acaulospora morrowiae TaxID=94023 RepID=A0A9N9G376_9GLOM|nr:535_t:CDS:2 [Acaulospora morrowiae]